jgi:vitamin B12 transporter
LRSRLEKSENSPADVGLPLLRRPAHSGTFDISWVEQRFDVSLDGIITGGRRDIDPVSGARFTATQQPILNDGYAKLNLAGNYRITQRVTAFARVENLLNQRYEEVLGYQAYKINARGGLRVRIGGGQ